MDTFFPLLDWMAHLSFYDRALERVGIPFSLTTCVNGTLSFTIGCVDALTLIVRSAIKI